MANQFTSGGGSKGPKKEHDQATKDKIRAELLAQRIYKFAKAKGKSVAKYKMDAAQVAAAKVLIDKGKPSLQAVEQSQANPWDSMTEEQLGEQVQALITSRPQAVLAAIDADPSLRAAVLAHITQKPVLVDTNTAQQAAK